MEKLNEKKLWDNLANENKSYTVKVLNFFHFRRNRINQSWRREEVITWELIRALDVLPRKYFLAELLKFVRDNNESLNYIAGQLLKNPNGISIVAYPKLNLKGNKKNSASDIELSYNGITLWIEAKIFVIKKEDLTTQIKNQKNALKKICNGQDYGIIALTPKNQSNQTDYIYWQDIKNIFKKALNNLEKDHKNSPQLIDGYKKIADELINRIEALFP